MKTQYVAVRDLNLGRVARRRPAGMAFRGLVMAITCGLAWAATPRPAIAASARPVASTNPVMAAVVNLVVLAEDGDQLTTLRTQLQKNVAEVRAAITSHEGLKPKQDATPAAMAAWQQKRDELAGKFGVVLGATDRFDHESFSAFRRKVEAAKNDLAAAREKVRATPDDDRRSAAAVARIDLAIVTILKLQTGTT